MSATDRHAKAAQLRADNDRLRELVYGLTAEVERLREENERLQATLDGDPHQTATPEQRRMWRASAIQYADKLEAENKSLNAENTRLTEALALLGVPANAEILDIVKIIANLAQMRGLVEKEEGNLCE